MKLFTLLACTFLTAALPATAAPEIVSVEKIWDSAPHSAFTDLTFFNGRWLCTFREGKAHVPVARKEGGQGDGVIRVISSTDGRQWSAAGLVTEDSIDLRDPHLSQMPDGRLMLIFGGSLYVGERYFTRQPRVSFSVDGNQWTPPHAAMEDGDWIWRATWHKGTAYGINKRVPGANNPRLPKRGYLVSSTDGRNWTRVAELSVPGIDEATALFDAEGEMTILARREEGDRHAWLGRSRPPYTQWQWQDCGEAIGGPNLVAIPGHGVWAGGRSYPDRKMWIGELRDGKYQRRLSFPSGGDNSYPGFVWKDGLLWMSYYSSHEGRTSIYLAKIRIAD